jgi:hypothetical protein
MPLKHLQHMQHLDLLLQHPDLLLQHPCETLTIYLWNIWDTWNICLQYVRHNTLVGGDHHVKRAKELDNRLDGQIGSRRRWSEEHHWLGRLPLCELLSLPRCEEPRGRREVRHGRDAVAISSCRRRWWRGRWRRRRRWEEEGGATTPAAEPSVAEASEGHGVKEEEWSLRRARGGGSRAEPAASAWDRVRDIFYLVRRCPKGRTSSPYHYHTVIFDSHQVA